MNGSRIKDQQYEGASRQRGEITDRYENITNNYGRMSQHNLQNNDSWDPNRNNFKLNLTSCGNINGNNTIKPNQFCDYLNINK